MATPIKQMTRERLKEAAGDMTILYEEGLSPANALLKVANDFQLQDEQIRFVGRAFNTAQSNINREEGKTLLEKLGSCPIVDVEEVLAKRATVKTASVVKTASIYDKDLNRDEFRNFSQKIKTAAFQFPEKPKPSPVNQPTFQKLSSDFSFLEQQQRTWQGKVHKYKEEFEKQASILRGTVKRLDRDRQTVLKLAALQRLGKDAPIYLHGIIDSDIRVPVKIASVVELDDPIIRKLAELKKTGDKFIDSLQKFQKISRCLNIVKNTMRTKIAAPPQSPPSQTKKKSKSSSDSESDFFTDWATQAHKLKKQHAESETKSENPWILNPVGTTLSKTKALWDMVTNPAPSGDSGYALTLPSPYQQFGLDLPSQQFKLDKIKVRSMLSDFLSNDEVIGSYDQDEVVSAFNELSDTAPEAMKKPAVARAMLREHLAKGSLGTYDISPLMQYEKQFDELRDNESHGDVSRQTWFNSPSGKYMPKDKSQSGTGQDNKDTNKNYKKK